MNKKPFLILVLFFFVFSGFCEDPSVSLEEILKEADPALLVESLKNALPDLPSVDLKKALDHLAAMEDMLGLLEEAGDHYLQAAFADTKQRDVPGMLASAAVQIEMDNLDAAETICKAVFNTAKDTVHKEQASVLLSRLLYLKGSPEEAWQALNTAALPVTEERRPSTLLWIHTLAGISGREDEKKTAGEILETHFGESPEAMILSGTARGYPTPALFFGLLKPSAVPAVVGEDEPAAVAEEVKTPETVMIQTGSFQDPENAEYHVKDLEEAGFTSKIVEKTMSGTVYHRVVIPDVPVEEVQKYLLRLKDRGYEGWPLYE